MLRAGEAWRARVGDLGRWQWVREGDRVILVWVPHKPVKK